MPGAGADHAMMDLFLTRAEAAEDPGAEPPTGATGETRDAPSTRDENSVAQAGPATAHRRLHAPRDPPQGCPARASGPEGMPAEAWLLVRRHFVAGNINPVAPFHSRPSINQFVIIDFLHACHCCDSHSKSNTITFDLIGPWIAISSYRDNNSALCDRSGASEIIVCVIWSSLRSPSSERENRYAQGMDSLRERNCVNAFPCCGSIHDCAIRARQRHVGYSGQ